MPLGKPLVQLLVVVLLQLLFSGSVLTIISLGASLLIEILLDYKNVNENMNNCKYAYQSYQHLMIQIKTALRLGQYNIQNLVNSIANLDNALLMTYLMHY